MINIIHIVGASGAGTSTLGQVLERKYGYKWLEDCSCRVIRVDGTKINAAFHNY